jgi:hypothetical protein
MVKTSLSQNAKPVNPTSAGSSNLESRQLSCFLRGLLTLLSDLLRDLPLHLCSWTTFPSTPVDSFYALNSS